MVLTNMTYRFFALTLLLSVSACTSLPPIQSQIPTDVRSEPKQQVNTNSPDVVETFVIEESEPVIAKKEVVSIVPLSPTTIATKQQNPAVIALLSSAQQANSNGDTRAAQSSLQRAQRIAPQDPDVYYALANIHRDLEDYRLAEQVALKGVSIMQGQAVQLKRFWLLIAAIRQDAGNITGAKKATQSAAHY